MTTPNMEQLNDEVHAALQTIYQQGAALDDLANTVIAYGISLAKSSRGPREVGQRLWMLAIMLAAEADAAETGGPKH